MPHRDHPARRPSSSDHPARRPASNDFGDVTVVTTQELRHGLADVLNRVAYRGDQVLVTRHGKPFVAIVSAADLQGFRLLEADADPEPGADPEAGTT